MKRNKGLQNETDVTMRLSAALLMLAALFTTFVFANQLSSIANLHQVDVNTTINGWSDVILHANTVLSLSSLLPGQHPVSTLDYRDPIIPYHYASYILSSLISSLSAQANPLATYVCIVAPLGCLLLLLPMTEQLLASTSRQETFSVIFIGSILFLTYSIWVRLIGDSSMDPAWLLITSPATLYACAIVISGLQIGATAQNRRSLSLVSLALLVFLLTAFSKIQIAHTLLPMLVIITSATTFRFLKWKQIITVAPWISVTLAGSMIALIHLYGNSLLGIGRKNPMGEMMNFFSETTNTTWARGELAAIVNNAWIAPALGFLTLCGPIFLIALISGARGQARSSFRVKLLILTTASYLLSLFLSPSMPWDSREFLNRSWPLLWCIGIWACLHRGPDKTEHQWPQELLITASVIAVIAGWNILPWPKRESIASPPNRTDWTKTFYPTTILSGDKKLAKELLESGSSSYFFASSSASNSNFIFDDLPSRLAALSGMRPVLSRLSFQKSLPLKSARNRGGLSIEQRYSEMLERYAKLCPVAGLNSPIKTFRSPGRNPDLTVDVICKNLEQPKP